MSAPTIAEHLESLMAVAAVHPGHADLLAAILRQDEPDRTVWTVEDVRATALHWGLQDPREKPIAEMDVDLVASPIVAEMIGFWRDNARSFRTIREGAQ